jgi:uncharacterized protein YbcV (DUF1398 family)
MDETARAVVRECSDLSDREAVGFADIVAKLMAAGVERYHADLTRSEKIYYWPDGSSEAVANAPVAGEAAMAFSAAQVAAAVRGAQAGTIRYKEFCERMMRAGCVGYHVHIAGKRVVYYGRSGDSHVEWFPGARP